MAHTYSQVRGHTRLDYLQGGERPSSCFSSPGSERVPNSSARTMATHVLGAWSCGMYVNPFSRRVLPDSVFPPPIASHPPPTTPAGIRWLVGYIKLSFRRARVAFAWHSLSKARSEEKGRYDISAVTVNYIIHMVGDTHSRHHFVHIFNPGFSPPPPHLN